MTTKNYNHIFSDPNIILGFELEFVCNKKYDEIKKELISDLNINPKSVSSKEHWALVNERGIELDNPGDQALELVSPPMQIKESLDYIKKIFSWMQKKKYYTNETTGFHMSISFKDKEQTRKIDPLKFTLFMGEEYVMKTFRRTMEDFEAMGQDSYAEPLIRNLKKDLLLAMKNSENIEEYMNTTNIKKWLMLARKELILEKFYSNNFMKLAHGYIEVRMVGNRAYHRKYDKIEEMALRFARVLEISFNPELGKKEYYKKVAKIMIELVGKIKSTNDDSVFLKLLDPKAVKNFYKDIDVMLPKINYPKDKLKFYLDLMNKSLGWYLFKAHDQEEIEIALDEFKSSSKNFNEFLRRFIIKNKISSQEFNKILKSTVDKNLKNITVEQFKNVFGINI